MGKGEMKSCTVLMLILCFILSACAGSPAADPSAQTQTPAASAAALKEEDCPKPFGRWRGNLESGSRLVAQVRIDGSVILFQHDNASWSADPAGKVINGTWTFITEPQKEETLTSVVGSNDELWSHWDNQFVYTWKFSSEEGRTEGLNRTVLYFIKQDSTDWLMVDPDETDTVGGFIFLRKDKDYEELQEENCPKPLGKYQANILINSTWNKVDYIEVREDGTVHLWYMSGDKMDIEMKGRWTLWANLEQEGSYAERASGDAWITWNKETRYVWRFDSEDSYRLPNGFHEPIGLLFIYKENGNLWLLHQGFNISQVIQLAQVK